MEIIKRNYKNPIKTAQRNFLAIGLLYIILGFLFYSAKPEVSLGILIAGVLVLIAAYFLGKRKMVGVYLGWVFVLFGVVSIFVNSAYISLIIVAYIGYWNYKASVAIKSQSKILEG